jgi:hypothetical protein
MFKNTAGNHDASVAAAGATDRNGQIRFILSLIQRDQIVKQMSELFQKCPGFRVG